MRMIKRLVTTYTYIYVYKEKSKRKNKRTTIGKHELKKNL